MASRAKKSRTKSGGSAGKKRGGPTARSGGAKSAKKGKAKRAPARKVASSRKPAAKKTAAKKTTRGPGLTKSAKTAVKKVVKPTMKKAVKRTAKKSGGSALSRVTRVAKEVAHQATSAVSDGVESIKEFGEGLVDRVTG